MENQVDKKGIIKALSFALIIAFLCIGILGWQYRKIEKEQIPALEEKIEQKTTETALDKFMDLRIEKNELAAMRYLTERAVEQKNKEEFSLIDEFKSYEVLKIEKTGGEKYRYLVKIYEEGGLSNFIEAITLIKILGQYYIDSVEIAG